MVWYQQFEYAISHWLQKAAENIMGCVLCSPGCFSLFRGSSLMDDNVMRRYTTPPTEPQHYVQYDQGKLALTHIFSELGDYRIGSSNMKKVGVFQQMKINTSKIRPGELLILKKQFFFNIFRRKNLTNINLVLSFFNTRVH